MIQRGAFFKTSALIEEYLKNAISDWLDRAISNGYTASSLPDELRWFYISKFHMSEYQKFALNRDEIKLIGGLKSKQQNKLLIDSNPLIGIIVPNMVVRDRKYPSIKNIKSLFSRIGIVDIFQRIDRRGRRSFEPIVQSFLDIREEIAHQSPPSLTLYDIRKHITDVQLFIATVDKELYLHVQRCHGSTCWRIT